MSMELNTRKQPPLEARPQASGEVYSTRHMCTPVRAQPECIITIAPVDTSCLAHRNCNMRDHSRERLDDPSPSDAKHLLAL